MKLAAKVLVCSFTFVILSCKKSGSTNRPDGGGISPSGLSSDAVLSGQILRGETGQTPQLIRLEKQNMAVEKCGIEPVFGTESLYWNFKTPENAERKTLARLEIRTQVTDLPFKGQTFTFDRSHPNNILAYETIKPEAQKSYFFYSHSSSVDNSCTMTLESVATLKKETETYKPEGTSLQIEWYKYRLSTLAKLNCKKLGIPNPKEVLFDDNFNEFIEDGAFIEFEATLTCKEAEFNSFPSPKKTTYVDTSTQKNLTFYLNADLKTANETCKNHNSRIPSLKEFVQIRSSPSWINSELNKVLLSNRWVHTEIWLVTSQNKVEQLIVDNRWYEKYLPGLTDSKTFEPEYEFEISGVLCISN